MRTTYRNFILRRHESDSGTTFKLAPDRSKTFDAQVGQTRGIEEQDQRRRGGRQVPCTVNRTVDMAGPGAGPIYNWLCVAHSVAEIIAHAVRLRAVQPAVVHAALEKRGVVYQEKPGSPQVLSSFSSHSDHELTRRHRLVILMLHPSPFHSPRSHRIPSEH